MKEILITAALSGGRLDKLLFRYLDKASSGFIYKMLRKKNITLNDKRAAGNEKLSEGDSVKLYLSDETLARFKSAPPVVKTSGKGSGKKADGAATTAPKTKKINLESYIIYEDENIIAMNKPAGLLSQKARKEDVSLNDFILDRVKGNEFFTPGIANRLDRNTSGIVLAGKNLPAQRELAKAFKERLLSKRYICLVMGKTDEKRTLDGWLLKDEKTNTVTVYSAGETMVPPEGAQRIVTAYEPLDWNDWLTLLEVDLITGKSHQIRAHLSSIDYPIVGDTKYGVPDENKGFAEKYGVKSQLLHGYKVIFENMEGCLEYLNGRIIEAELPPKFLNTLKGEGIWQHGTQGV